jgi:hypothetical protein
MGYSFKSSFESMADDVDVYPDGDTVRVEFRLPFDGEVRSDTRSSVEVNPSTEDVLQATIRLPTTGGDAQELQDRILMISRRMFGDDSGCYVRGTGRIHLKYPVSGQIFDYAVSDFLDDVESFREEVVSKDIL